MNWDEIGRHRAVPGAGVFIALTRRCPLHCAHCSTNSTLASPEQGEEHFRAFVDTFTDGDHPAVVWFTGGEPLLRPALVHELAAKSRAIGATTAITTGLHFGRAGKIPSPVRDALDQIDFITISMDRWHQQEVPRDGVFRCIQRLLDDGASVGVQATGVGHDDPHLGQLLDDIEEQFDQKVGVYVGLLKPAGRGRALMARLEGSEDDPGRIPQPQGCGGLSWPVFGFGQEYLNACCNQEAIDERTDHLRLPMSWPELVATLRSDPILRVINTVGPRVLSHKLDQNARFDLDYCATCRQLAGKPGLREVADAVIHEDAWPVFETVVSDLRSRIGDPTMGQPEFAGYRHWGV